MRGRSREIHGMMESRCMLKRRRRRRRDRIANVRDEWWSRREQHCVYIPPFAEVNDRNAMGRFAS